MFIYILSYFISNSISVFIKITPVPDQCDNETALRPFNVPMSNITVLLKKVVK
jgi:hypothetical protein